MPLVPLVLLGALEGAADGTGSLPLDGAADGAPVAVGSEDEELVAVDSEDGAPVVVGSEDGTPVVVGSEDGAADGSEVGVEVGPAGVVEEPSAGLAPGVVLTGSKAAHPLSVLTSSLTEKELLPAEQAE